MKMYRKIAANETMGGRLIGLLFQLFVLIVCCFTIWTIVYVSNDLASLLPSHQDQMISALLRCR
jgi:hypothetical protein